MATPGGCGDGLALRDVAVRPVRDAAERRRWDALLSQFHYLPYNGLFGQSLRHVAECGGRWVALVGWTAGAFKVGVRDAWIGWPAERQFRRLRLVANNSRFAVLSGRGEARNLASRVLGLSLRRVSRDMCTAHGHPVLLAETFVDPSRFSGVCYRASNWVRLGLTSGYSRVYGSPVRWRAHGRPKEVYVYELRAGAREALRAGDDPAGWAVERRAAAPTVEALCSLHAFFGAIPDFRKRRGQRYGLACYLTIMVAARLAGYRGVTAFGEFAARLDAEQRRAVGGFDSPTRGCCTVPAVSSFHQVLSRLPPDALDEALRAWSAQHAGRSPVAIDGKDIRGASRRDIERRRMTVAAVEHGSGLVLGQVRIGAKSNEIPAVRELARQLDLTGRVVTLDAMHAQHDTARCLVEDCRADYLVTAVKGNQPTLHEDLAAIDWSRARWSAAVVGKAHGRLEIRRCAAEDLDDAQWNGLCDLPGRRQALRIERERTVLKTGRTTREVAYGITSLGADAADPGELLDHVRRHWEVENRLHYVRDFSYDEDRCRAAAGHLPQNLAALSNAAISIVRVTGRFDHIPEANRHYAARPQEALDAVLNPVPN